MPLSIREQMGSHSLAVEAILLKSCYRGCVGGIDLGQEYAYISGGWMAD
ncbi:MAG: hypothetical protein ABFS10_06680 [Bacteroidota bacterium]